jgi:acid phosphatase family membrane protein YuiD
VLQRIIASKARQAANIVEGATTLERLWANGKHTLPFLLAAAPVALIPPTAWEQLGGNYVFMTGFCGWFLAQFLKIFTKWYKTGIFSVKAFVDSGGMPSSHSSLCSAVTTAVALQQGLGSPLFAMCTCFSVIVMYDAMGVRRHAGLQAEVLNAVVEDLLEGHPVSERKLKEVLGHTPRQVLCGAALGILVGLVCPRPF